MREEAEAEPNWFPRWEDELPSPEELMPLSQSLISPHLALAFSLDISPPPPNPKPSPPPPPDPPSAAADDSARTLKRPRLVWTPQLHKRFVDAVAHLGIKNAVPKTIMHLMSVDGLTRENVASHLQKYRLYLKRMQGLSSSSSSAAAAADAAAEHHLFSSTPIPRPFLSRHHESYVQFIDPPLLQQQMAAVQNQQYYHQRQIGHLHRIGVSSVGLMQAPTVGVLPNCNYGDDADVGGRRVLTLFPTGTED